MNGLEHTSESVEMNTRPLKGAPLKKWFVALTGLEKTCCKGLEVASMPTTSTLTKIKQVSKNVNWTDPVLSKETNKKISNQNCCQNLASGPWYWCFNHEFSPHQQSCPSQCATHPRVCGPIATVRPPQLFQCSQQPGGEVCQWTCHLCHQAWPWLACPQQPAPTNLLCLEQGPSKAWHHPLLPLQNCTSPSNFAANCRCFELSRRPSPWLIVKLSTRLVQVLSITYLCLWAWLLDSDALTEWVAATVCVWMSCACVCWVWSCALGSHNKKVHRCDYMFVVKEPQASCKVWRSQWLPATRSRWLGILQFKGAPRHPANLLEQPTSFFGDTLRFVFQNSVWQHARLTAHSWLLLRLAADPLTAQSFSPSDWMIIIMLKGWSWFWCVCFQSPPTMLVMVWCVLVNSPPCVVNSFLKLKRNKIRYDSTYYGMFMRFECFHQ